MMVDGVPAQPGPQWRRNLGAPPEGRFKRVRVVLRHGREPQYADELNAMAPPGWSVETTRWSLHGGQFDVTWFLPIGSDA